MVERGEDFGFALEAGESIGVGGHGRGQHLDGDLAFQVAVGGAIDLPHTTLAEDGGHTASRARTRAGSLARSSAWLTAYAAR